MTWFKTLTGFYEDTYESTQDKLTLDGSVIRSTVNGKSYEAGILEITNLDNLRSALNSEIKEVDRVLRFSEVVGDVQQLHIENPGAVFQVASQFNLLEMMDSKVTPEKGIGRYEWDNTQGPACAIACGAGTIYRNYLVPVGDQIGQTADCQIDCLKGIGEALNNDTNKYWNMTNGYAMLNPDNLEKLHDLLANLTNSDRDILLSKLGVGVQWDTEITLNDNKDTVTQVYASALPLGYLPVNHDLCKPLAQIVLDATYEAAFLVAIKNKLKTGNNKLFLTLVGGGVFENSHEWIISAIRKAATKFQHIPLDVRIVSYGSSNPVVRDLVDEF